MKHKQPVLTDEIINKLNQGLGYHQQGQPNLAKHVYESILKEYPNQADACHLLGILEHQYYNNHHKALELLNIAVEKQPLNHLCYLNRSNILGHFGRLDEALLDLSKAIKYNPKFAEAYNNRGTIYKRLNKKEEAEKDFKKAVQFKSDYDEAFCNLGLVTAELGNITAAKKYLDEAIRLNPNKALSYYNRGRFLFELKEFDNSINDYNKAIELNPNYAQAYNNKGTVYQDQGDFETAYNCYNEAIRSDPNYVSAYFNRGTVAGALGNMSLALENYDIALKLNPDQAEQDIIETTLREIEFNKSLILLLKGDYIKGWELYKNRFDEMKNTAPVVERGKPFTAPQWFGEESLKDKTILVYTEQGFGDTFQFCRYLKLLSDLGATVIFEVEAALIEPLKTLEGVDSLIGKGSEIPHYDYHSPLLTLPMIFKTTVDTIPAGNAYLKSDPKKVEYWRNKMSSNKFKIGLVWSGGFRPNQPKAWGVNKRRNLPLEKLARLKEINAEFYSLQKGEPAESEFKELLSTGWDGPDIIDFTSEFYTFADTGALIENLDLVISVDTSTLHFAAALGKPVWLLNRFDTCWRWFLDREDSPWYPTLKIYRQDSPGNWEYVIDKVIEDLKKI